MDVAVRYAEGEGAYFNVAHAGPVTTVWLKHAKQGVTAIFKDGKDACGVGSIDVSERVV